MIKLRTFNPHIGMVHLVRGAKAGAVSGVIYGAVNVLIINIGINLINGQLGNFVTGIMTDGLWLVGATLMNSILGAVLGLIFGLIFVVLYDRLPGITSTDKGIVTSIIHWAAIPLGVSVLFYPEGLSVFFRSSRNWRVILIGLGTSILWGWLLGHFWERGRPGLRPGKIKTRMLSPVKVTVIAFSIILISLNMAQSWGLIFPCPKSQTPPFTPESIETLTITTDTILTEDYFNTTIVIGADDITLDGNDHWIIGPSPDYIYYPDTEDVMPNVTIGILLKGRTGVTIKNCRVTSFTFGFHLDSSNGNTLQENTATNNGDGFILWESDGNSLQGNTANDNVFGGFYLGSSSDNILRDNTANGSGDDPQSGFGLGRSFRNTFQGNTANDNLNGFGLEESDGNIFRGNTVNNNTLSGFMVGYSSDNILTSNTVSNNTIEIWWGSYNRIYHNNFVDNLQHVTIEDSVNTWDDGYLSGGNYWSDYTGIDADGDGIGDTPYVIDENNVDQFLLMAPINADA